MRLPLTPKTDSRDGVSDKDSRLTNALVEDGKVVARPGIQEYRSLSTAATGKGLVEFNGKLISAAGQAIYTEIDQVLYPSVKNASAIAYPFSKTTFHKGLFYVACSDATRRVFASADAVTWSEKTALATPATIKALGSSKTTLCAIYNNASSKASTKTSTDGGVTWTANDNCFSSTIALTSAAIHFNGHGFIAALYDEDVDETTMWSSSNGRNWSQGSGTFVFVTEMATGKGVTVAIDDNNGPSKYTTNNGKTWASCSGLGATQNPVSIAYGNGSFIAVSQDTGSPAPTGEYAVYASRDGITWKYVSSVAAASSGSLVHTGSGFLYQPGGTTTAYVGNGLSDWSTVTVVATSSGSNLTVGNNLVVQYTSDAGSTTGTVVMEVDNLSSIGTVAGDFFDFVESAT